MDYVAIPKIQLGWFAHEVVGKSETAFLRGAETSDRQNLVKILGTRRLGLPHRDVDLFTLGVEQKYPSLEPVLEGVVFDTMTFKSEVTGRVRVLQKVRGRSAEGRDVTLTANPLSWWKDQDAEYARACDLLQDEVVAALYLRLREEKKKVEAYRLLGVKMSEERA